MFPGFRMIDLSVPLEHQAVSEPLPAQIKYDRHNGEGLRQMQHFFGVRPDDLVYSNGLGWAIEEVQAITHTGPTSMRRTIMARPRRASQLVRLTRCRWNGVSHPES